MIRFDKVSMRYGAGPQAQGGPEVLSDISFTLQPGSFHFLTGPSGAGKSSLLRLMFLAQRPAKGRIHIFGRDLAHLGRDELPAIRRRIGVVFQDFRLIPHLSVLDNVALPLRLAGGGEAEIRAHVGELLHWVGLGDALDAVPSELSGGQQQRAAIARAVINRPRLLLADEPTGNVDDDAAVRLLHLFVELNKLGTTVVIATHSSALLQRFGHPQLHLNGGRLLRIEREEAVA